MKNLLFSPLLLLQKGFAPISPLPLLAGFATLSMVSTGVSATAADKLVPPLVRSSDEASIKLASEAPPALRTVRYRLLEGSQLLDDCPICDRLSRPVPLRGELDLVLVRETPIESVYEIANAKLVADPGTQGERIYLATGEYSQGGEVALRQQMTLNLRTEVNPGPPVSKTLTNGVPQPGRLWPMIGIELDDTDPTETSTYHVTILAAPVREIWFSTRAGLTSGTLTTNGVSIRFAGDDLLSEAGRLVWSGSAALEKLQLETAADTPGVDCISPSPGGEVLWSLDAPASSPLLGKLQEGDALSNQPKLWKSNQELIGKFGLQPPIPDLGLDALQVLTSGEVLFSTRVDGFSEVLGEFLHHGDLLSNSGQIRRTNQDLLSRFKPSDPTRDYGLDAIYVWSSGEVWFSVADGFIDSSERTITDGDLLSDQGYVVMRNLDLLAKFQPLEDLAQFGLDSLLVVSDAEANPTPPVLLSAGPLSDGSAFHLKWRTPGSAVQVEFSLSVPGPYLPLSPILTGTECSLPITEGFFRLRQW
jgi:hypothetical protein